MIDYTYKDLFMDDSVSKQLIIEYENTVITNEDLFNQTMTLEESLCSEDELRFGCCEASVLKFKVANIVAPMKDKWLSVKMVLNSHTDEPFIIGKYKVEEDKETADRRWREIVAYDAMYDIINADASEMAAWYNELLPDDNEDTWVTMRSFRTSFLQHFGIEQETAVLINDYMKVERTIAPEQISGKDIITAICEINGCFGHIGRDGKFHYIYLSQAIQGLYPANDLFPSDDLFPRDPKGERIGANGTYIDVKWENFVTKSINKIQIRQEENDIGKIYPDTPISDADNSYIIENNFLVYGKSSDELLPITQNILSKITGIEYRPLTNSDIKGNPCFEVGDPIRIGTKYELVETYILERTLKGIQALRDAYKSNGVEKYSEQVNGVHSSIIQLKGKTNILTRTIEETKSEIKDIEGGLETKILQNAKEIELEAKRAIGQEVELAAAIKVTSDNITAEVKRASGAEEALQNDYTAKIKLTADQLSTEITEKTQVQVVGEHTIKYEGSGKPQMPADPYRYYLDIDSGAIYVGVDARNSDGWYIVASYKYDADSDTYKKEYIIDGYNAPQMLINPLEQYGYVNDGDVEPDTAYQQKPWLAVSDSGGLLTVRYYVYELAHPAEWRIAGTIETLPEMSSRITQTAEKIELKVSKGNVTSQLLVEPTDIYLKTGRLRIETDNLEINKDGSSGEILSRNLSQSGVTKQTARYIKLNSGGLEGGYGNMAKCKIQCSSSGLAFRGASMTFCMDNIYVGTSMNATKTNKAYTGDIAYAAPENGDVTKLNAGIMHVWNGLVLDNGTYN